MGSSSLVINSSMMIMKFMTIAVFALNLVVASDVGSEKPCDDAELVEGVDLDREQLEPRVRVQLKRVEHPEAPLKKKLRARPMLKERNSDDKDASERSNDNVKSRFLSTPEQMISKMIKKSNKPGKKLEEWMEKKGISSRWECACDSGEDADAECVVFWDVYEFRGLPETFCLLPTSDTKPETCTCTPDEPAEPNTDDLESTVDNEEPVTDDLESTVDNQEPIPDDQDTPDIPQEFDGNDGSESENTEATAWVLEHNIYRCMHDVPLVEWSEEMYNDAVASFKGKTAFEHSTDRDFGTGENLAWRSPTAFDPFGASEAWYSEVDNCTSWPGCIPGNDVVGHFTAMVWKGVNQIGCYTNEAAITVCRYRCSGDHCSFEEMPNMQGSYESQVLPPNGKSYETCKDEIEGRRLAIFV